MGAHGAADEDGLADQLVVDRDEGVVGRERTCAALAVHQQLLRHAIHQVLLHLPRTAHFSTFLEPHDTGSGSHR